MSQQQLQEQIRVAFKDTVDHVAIGDMVTIELPASSLLDVATVLRDKAEFDFKMLVDLCGVDYLTYGVAEWRTEEATSTGYSRGVNGLGNLDQQIPWKKPRYAVVYHLLSITLNQRVRLKVYLDEEPIVPSVVDIWPVANWYEREAFDLFGIFFQNHPDLRRILTDYGFMGHPFRKDFPLIGEVEMRYDAAQERCIYEPVSIKERVLVPKVIRDDNRYTELDVEEGKPHA